jgi:pSer/pThr/pTyr-binding forkhead associated (FHA) protein
MQLRYLNHLGKQVEVTLGEEEVIIGRSNEVDVVLPSDKVSRRHAALRFWGGDYVLKDLKSRNGTFVNTQKVSVAKLEPGDSIRLGEYELHFEKFSPKAPNTIIRKIGQEMADEGKGYSTMLRAIVRDAEDGAEHPDGDTQ